MFHLILVHQQSKQAKSDYKTIAERIAALDQELRVFIVDTKQLDWPLAEQAAAQPTLVVSPMPIKKFVAPRGRILQGYDFPKSEQYRRLRAHGIAVPDWIAVEPGVSLDPAEWGDYVSGPRVIGPEAKAAMRQILAEIQDGTFAKAWVAENEAGLPEFKSRRRAEQDQPIEKVGRELRGMMPFVDPVEIKPGD